MSALQEKRDFGQRKRAVTIAKTSVLNIIATYESIDAEVITDHDDAEELLAKVRHFKRTLSQH